jgi:uncharacterized membrane protein YbjE (DUF340 family)
MAMKNSFIMLSVFVAGVIIGLFSFLPSGVMKYGAELYALYLLMLLVGISIGSDIPGAWRLLKKLHIRIAMVPLAVIIGTFAGVSLVPFFLPGISFKDALAVGSGFGYYSLSSILLSELKGEVLGVIALLANIIRELITVIGAPLFVRFFGKLSPITSGGATSMDTTLPVITRFSGKEYATISVFSGTILTILVPFLVTLFARM